MKRLAAVPAIDVGPTHQPYAGTGEIQRALAQVIPKLHLTATYAGTQTVSARQRGGPGTYRESGWNDSCSCITYRGPVRAVPGT